MCIGSMFINFSDNLIFYYVYKCFETKVPFLRRVAIFIYALVFLYLTWIPSDIILPFFLNTNSVEYNANIGLVFDITFAICTGLYNLVFTYQFVMVLRRHATGERIQTSEANLIFAFKCCIHFFSSTGISAFVFFGSVNTQLSLLVSRRRCTTEHPSLANPLLL